MGYPCYNSFLTRKNYSVHPQTFEKNRMGGSRLLLINFSNRKAETVAYWILFALLIAFSRFNITSLACCCFNIMTIKKCLISSMSCDSSTVISVFVKHLRAFNHLPGGSFYFLFFSVSPTFIAGEGITFKGCLGEISGLFVSKGLSTLNNR